MKKQRISFVMAIFGAFLAAFGGLKPYPFDKPAHFPAPVYDFSKNELSAKKVALGRALFYDPLLSRDSTISCASCHSPYSAFTHVDHNVSHGIQDRRGTRNAPVLMNLAWQQQFMWDGAVNHLDVQSLAPISNPDEMGETLEHVVKKLQASARYRELFNAAFQDSFATGERTLKSLSQFMLTLVSANAKYDKVIRKEATFTDQEANGYALFKTHCAACHAEPLFSTFAFANNGLPPDSSFQDKGRMKISGNPGDSLRFKIPTLRNVEFSYPYMHDGRFKRLSQVLNHYSSGIQDGPTLAPELRGGIPLSSNEKVDLIAFLLTLSDRDFIFNANFGFPGKK